MNFSTKSILFYLSLLSYALPSVAMQLQGSYIKQMPDTNFVDLIEFSYGLPCEVMQLQMPYVKQMPCTNFVHMTELHENNPDEQLRKALYSFKPNHVVLRNVKNAIHQGADVKSLYEDGKTPLHKAFEWPDMDIARELVKASPSIVNSGGVLGHAIERKDVRAVKFLLHNKINIKKGTSPLKLIIDNARYNRPNARGGLSYWPTTEELVGIVGEASSPAAIKEAKKYLTTKPYNDHYAFYIRKPLSKIAAEKERANGFSPSQKRKSQNSGSDSSPAKKRKSTNGESLSLSQEIILREGKRPIKSPNRFNSSLTPEEVDKIRAKRLQLQRLNDIRRTKK